MDLRSYANGYCYFIMMNSYCLHRPEYYSRCIQSGPQVLQVLTYKLVTIDHIDPVEQSTSNTDIEIPVIPGVNESR